MRILGIDTATSLASVALLENGRLLAAATHPPQGDNELAVALKSNHAETVLPLIQGLLDGAALGLADLGAIAISIGPGSFTGLRIGLALVKGIAYEHRLPVLGVSSLEARAASLQNSSGPICALLDARKDEVYVALFHASDGKLSRRSEDQALPVAELSTLIGAEFSAVKFVGNGAQRYRHELTQMFDRRAEIIDQGSCGNAAAALAVLACRRLGDAPSNDLGALQPLYLGASQALGSISGIVPNQLK